MQARRGQMQAWLGKAGLDIVEVRDLKPESDREALTVTIWLARDRRLEIAADIPAVAAAGRRI